MLPALGGVEDLLEVLLGLADVLADDRGQVELEHVEAEAPAMISDASVLPVPDGPANSATKPLDGLGENPQSS